MIVYDYVVIDMDTNEIIEQSSYDYVGEVVLCCGGSGGDPGPAPGTEGPSGMSPGTAGNLGGGNATSGGPGMGLASDFGGAATGPSSGFLGGVSASPGIVAGSGRGRGGGASPGTETSSGMSPGTVGNLGLDSQGEAAANSRARAKDILTEQAIKTQISTNQTIQDVAKTPGGLLGIFTGLISNAAFSTDPTNPTIVARAEEAANSVINGEFESLAEAMNQQQEVDLDQIGPAERDYVNAVRQSYNKTLNTPSTRGIVDIASRKLSADPAGLSAYEKALLDEIELQQIDIFTQTINDEVAKVAEKEIANLVGRGVLQGTIGQQALADIYEQATKSIESGTIQIQTERMKNELALMQGEKELSFGYDKLDWESGERAKTRALTESIEESRSDAAEEASKWNLVGNVASGLIYGANTGSNKGSYSDWLFK